MLEQTTVEEIKFAEESIKMQEHNDPSDHGNEETNAPSESKNQTGDIQVEDSSTRAKKETNQQQHSMSVPSYPPQLKSILQRSNAPKSLSLGIHDIDEDTSDKETPLAHKMSVSYNNHLMAQ